MKHIAIDLHFVRDLVTQGLLKVAHVSTIDQLTDALTKPLSLQHFHLLRSKIGVTDNGFILWGRIREAERVSNIAYDLENGKCSPVKDQYARVYITIGDGGNIEGLATNVREPQPAYSAYREASFGHAIFNIKNRTHAFYGWLDDGVAVKADSMWLFNRFDHPVDDSTSSQS
ncbi:PREDICTED: purple acid phosphatase 2-like [Prunus mume]|uniref:Purple acid phosphatase 2-like n=1 Tax=Prunus mume TaxID=102107 RepID=A0ABM0PB67_PRUMU|nr:PREDICTED: purple acid phosphatase 2-like [Prunus mume]